MARIFTSNQVNHVYVVKDVKTAADAITSEGDVYVSKDAENNLYVQQHGKGGITRTDLIENPMYAKLTSAVAMRKNLTNAFITFDSNVVASTATAGADYILNVEMQNPIGMSPDNTYLQSAVARAFTGANSKSLMYAKLAVNLAQNFSRLETPLFEVHLVSTVTSAASIVFGTNTTEITKSVLASIHPNLDNLTTILSGTYTGIALREVSHDWILGLKQDKPLVYEITSSYVENAASNSVPEDYHWATIVYFDGYELKNGHAIADLEYFHMGERADQYRMSGWPNYIPTEYMVDPTKEYDVISIHYAYVGSNEAVQKSEKEVTFLCERSNSDAGVWKKSGSSDIAGAYTDAAVAAATASFGDSIDTIDEAEEAGWKWTSIGAKTSLLVDKINALSSSTGITIVY